MEYADGKEMTRCKTCDGTDFEYVDGKDPKCMTCRPAASTAAMDMAYEKRVREALEEIVHSEVTVKQMKDHLKAASIQPPSNAFVLELITTIGRVRFSRAGSGSGQYWKTEVWRCLRGEFRAEFRAKFRADFRAMI